MGSSSSHEKRGSTEQKQGPKVSPALRERLMAQWKAIYASIDEDYPAFLSEARIVLHEHSRSMRFGFIIRRLWMEDVGELDADWRSTLRSRYEHFERGFDWTTPVGVSINEQFLARTLSVWQRRYLTKLKIAHAVEIITNVANLGLRT